MKAHKMKKIAVNVTQRIIIGLLAVFTVLIIVVATIITTDLVDRELEKLTMLANENAKIARDFMESTLNKQEVLITTTKSLTGLDTTAKLSSLEKIITNTVQSEKNILSLFMIAEPDVFSANTPNGYSIFATDAATNTQPDMYKYINKELYLKAKDAKTVTVIDPFEKTIDGKRYKVITVLLPILGRNGEFTGLIGSNIDTELLNGANYNEGGFSTFTTQIICGHQTVITNNHDSNIIGKKYTEVSESTNTQKILDSAKNASPFTFLDKNTDGQKYYKSYVPFFIHGSSVPWLSGTSITKAEFDMQIIRQVALIGFWLVIALVVLTMLVYWRVKVELRPIPKLEAAVKELSKGNLHGEIDFTSDNELGSLAESLRNSTHTIKVYVSDIDRAMGEMSSGNFNIAPSQPFIGDFKNIETSINKFAADMSVTLMQIAIAADQVSTGADHVSGGAQELAQSATEQASSVEELSAELTAVTTHINTTASNAATANQLADTVGAEINTSNEQMGNMMSAMTEISSSSSLIGKIIKTIEDIAFQTNILALNASVEAARAGAAGKGFAVVADEVRNLATKSSEAAKQTNVLIESSVNAVSNGVNIANETAKSLASVVTGAETITKLIAQITEASKEQSTSISQINLGVEQISAVVQTNSATSEESAAASEELSGQATMMKGLVSKFTLADEAKISAASAARRTSSEKKANYDNDGNVNYFGNNKY